MNRVTQLSIAALGIFLFLGVSIKCYLDLQSAKVHYHTESHADSLLTAHSIENTFTALYQGLRTMARLPGVRTIDRHAKHFAADSSIAVQEIYNNLGLNVAMSEVYIVPRDIDPDVIDPVTGKPAIPITTYDHLILNKSSDTADPADPTPEVETYEYRLEKQQEAWFAANFPTEDKIAGFNYPALCGPQVITCDNSKYNTSKPDDRDRSGLVYSVPFYGPDKVFKGSTTGIILTKAIRDLLPSPNFVVRNSQFDYSAVPTSAGIWDSSRKWYSKDEVRPDLIYSEIIPLNVVDNQGQWKLWCARSNDDYWARADVKGAIQFAIVGYIFTGLLIGGIVFGLNLMHKNKLMIEQKNAELESRVEERTNALLASKVEQDKLVENLKLLVSQIGASGIQLSKASVDVANRTKIVEAAATEIIGSVREVRTASSHSAETAEVMANGSANQAKALNEGSYLVQELNAAVQSVAKDAEQATLATERANAAAHDGAVAVEKATSGMQRVETAVMQSAKVIQTLGEATSQIGTIVQTIETIASQTNLLALNAAIEAARAGESGRGFAVVADEVGKLAERSRIATQEIGTLIERIQKHTAEAVSSMEVGKQEVVTGMSLAEEASKALSQIQEVVSGASSQVMSISAANEQMLASAEEVSRTIAEVANMVESSSSGADQVSASAQQVADAIQVVEKIIGTQNEAVVELVRSSTHLEEIAASLEEATKDIASHTSSLDGQPELRIAA